MGRRKLAYTILGRILWLLPHGIIECGAKQFDGHQSEHDMGKF
jgi:hypothetical protein